MKQWALLDDEGEPVRFFSYQAVGTVKFPADPEQIPIDSEEWDKPLF